MCPPSVATTSDNRLWNCPIARSMKSWPICSQQVYRTSFGCSMSRVRRKNATVCRERWADAPSCWKVKLLFYQTTSAYLVVNRDSDRRHNKKNCRIWLQAEQTPVTLFYANFRKLGWKVEQSGLFCAILYSVVLSGRKWKFKSFQYQ